jgi:hypothetical protein
MGSFTIITISTLTFLLLASSVSANKLFLQQQEYDHKYEVYEESLEKNVISSPNLTNYGYWGEWENCPEDSLFVTAFQLKVEPKNSLIDDSGLNGIRLFCGRPQQQQQQNDNDNANTTEDNETVTIPPPEPIWRNVTSSVGIFGYWGIVFNCTTYAVGFNLEVVPPQGKYRVSNYYYETS